MYVTLEEARDEVWKRWNNKELRQKVLEYVGELPEGFGHEPKAALVRHIATMNFEFLRFSNLAKETGLRPYCSEFIGDKFCSKNQEKLLLAKVTFYHGKGKQNGNKTVRHNLIDFYTEDGKNFQEVSTVWGESLVSFHHRLVSSKLKDVELNDITAWFQAMGSKPEYFYNRLLAIFVCHGIMFENFVADGEEGAFTQNIVWPAIERVKEHFGLKPLIVPLVPIESELDPYWCWYPGNLEFKVKSLLYDK
jgi:hypothetical protein